MGDEEVVVAVAPSSTGGWWVDCAQGCDRPDTHGPVRVRTEGVAQQIAAVRRRQHGTPYGGEPR